MKLLTRIVPASLTCLLAGTALALPPIMDRVPGDTALAICVPSMEKLEAGITNLTTTLGLPKGPGIDQLLNMMGVTGGIAKTGSMVMVIKDLPAKGEHEPKMVVLVPVSDYKALLKSFGKDAPGAFDEIKLQGEPAFIKPIDGGYAVIAHDKPSLDGFDAKPGNAAAHKSLIGAIGDRLSDQSDLSVFLNIAKIRPMLKAGIEEGLNHAQDNMEMGGQDMGAQMEMAKWATNLWADETRAGVFALKLDNLGVSLDMSLAFNEGSKLAAATATPGKATALLGKVPAQNFLFAGAADFSAPGLQALMKSAPTPKGADGKPGINMGQSIEGLTGGAMCFGVNPGGMMAGLLTQGVFFGQTADPAKAVDTLTGNLKKAATAANGTADYKADAAEVSGVKVGEYSASMSSGEPMAEQVMGLMFGMGNTGPQGYIAQAGGGVVQTYSKSTPLMESALRAATKGDNSLGADKLIQQIGEKLPANRSAEFYIGTKGLMDSIVPMMAMAGMNVKMDIPSNLPPIGAAIAPDKGSAQLSIYVPNVVIKTFADFGKSVQAQMGGAGMGNDDNGDKPAKKKQKDEPGF